MQALMKLVQEISLFIVDNDYLFGMSVKRFLENQIGESIAITVFQDTETCLLVMKSRGEKPHLVILDYSENSDLNKKNTEQTIKHIKELNPDTVIIVLSDKADSLKATMALARGAQYFVLKDQFANEHIFSAVTKCLHPAKV
jgi:DNA-binding NarL/FixJ family response regulator